MAGEVFAIYGTLPSYRAMLDREGVVSPADIPLVGDAGTVEAELRRLADIGVTDLLAALSKLTRGQWKGRSTSSRAISRVIPWQHWHHEQTPCA